jgi:hypothetical protein
MAKESVGTDASKAKGQEPVPVESKVTLSPGASDHSPPDEVASNSQFGLARLASSRFHSLMSRR